MDALPPPPTEAFLPWAMQHPEAVRDYLVAVQALSRLQVEIIDANGVARKGTVRLSPGSAVIQIRLS